MKDLKNLARLIAGEDNRKVAEMTINDAIDRLTNIASEKWRTGETTNLEAVRLGIEALNRVRRAREIIENWKSRRLPGETE